MADELERKIIEEETFRHEALQGLRLLDDVFMSAVFEDPRCVEQVLRIVMNRPDLEVCECEVKRDLVNVMTRSVQVDVFAIDSNGKRYDIEVQRNPYRAGPRRARYYGAVLDSKALGNAVDHSELPETYVVFITETDVFKAGLAVYHVSRWVEETGTAYDDGLHIIYVNCAYKDDGSPLGDLAHDFRCTDPKSMRYNVLKERSEHVKRGDKEVAMYSQTVDDLAKKFQAHWEAQARRDGWEKGQAEGLQAGREAGLQAGRAEGREEGLAKARLEIATSLLTQGALSKEQIAAATGLSVEEIERLAKTGVL